MGTRPANGDFRTPSWRLHLWRRVREFAVPEGMIETAAARRAVGDWAGACAAARVYVELDLRIVASRHGRELAGRVRADLRGLAPDLLRWHLPRTAPDGLLRPGLTVTLARYERPDAAGRRGRALHLVARTPPGWADAGQRFSLALWDPAHPHDDADLHPHPRPSRRFRMDLHRHLWDARVSDELRHRSGFDRLDESVAERWAAEAELLLGAEGRRTGRVGVRIGSRRLLVLGRTDAGAPVITAATDGGDGALPLLPDAATWVPPDAELLRAGLIGADALHPLVASALAPEHRAAAAPVHESPKERVQFVECRGARHRIAVVDGVLAPLDHEPDELHREELLAALAGTPLPCLRAVDRAHRNPASLDDVRGRLDHGDVEGAVAVVTSLLGPDAVLRDGALRDELDAAALRRIDHGLYRAGLAPSLAKALPRPPRRDDPARRALRTRPRDGVRR
ncbi:hypothetical protein [Streptacidiphilus melanogenes]|uniref:hypothetical protein n=1 Tax=Streptacidiphilus melanogenes TaxID=411235 RepID=UPI0005A89B24|nr:hypothetical protein [Streptacidiphilus melanogenes]